MKQVEVIAINIEDILIINNFQVDSIELCIDLQKGGITPDIDMIKKVNNISKNDIYLMLRYRDDYTLTLEDEKKIKLLIESIKDLNQIKGLVFGFNNNQHELNNKTFEYIKTFSKKYTITIHRCIEKTNNIIKTVNTLNNYPIDQILTNGGDISNLNLLKEIKNISKHTIKVGGGVSWKNIDKLIPFFDYIHVGSMIREEESFNKPISKEKLNNLINKIRGYYE